jgi:hypothetical protein
MEPTCQLIFSYLPSFFSLTPLSLSSPCLPALALAPLEGGGVLWRWRRRPSSSGCGCFDDGGRAAQVRDPHHRLGVERPTWHRSRVGALCCDVKIEFSTGDVVEVLAFQSDDSLLLHSSPRPTSPVRERRSGMRHGPTASRRREVGSVWWRWDCGGDKIHVKARGAQSSDNGEAWVELVSYSSTALAIASLTSVPTACRHRRDGDPTGKEAEQPPLADRAPPAVPSRGKE